MRVIVCGGRSFLNRAKLFDGLDSIHKESPITLLIHGGCQGADSLAGEWASEHGINTMVFRADWGRYGPGAGPVRNRQMIEEGKPEMVIAFPGTNGTSNMIKQASKNGIEVRMM